MKANIAKRNAELPENTNSLKELSLVVDSDEINFMVYRYLLESGFVHTAFSLHHEALLDRYKIDNAQIPPGILLSFVQRGIDFLTIEEKACGKSFDYLRDTTAPGGKRSLLDFHRYMSNLKMKNALDNQNEDIQMTDSSSEEPEDNSDIPGEERENCRMIRNERDENVLLLCGHRWRALDCKWDLHSLVLASCSYDNTARIWLIPENFREDQAAGYKANTKYKTLKHDILTRASKNVPTNSLEVTAVGWNNTGNTLATGTDDGITRLWAPNGHVEALVQNHSGSVIVLKWNPSSTSFVTGSSDTTAAVCHKETAKCFKRFRHEDAIYDLDWKDDDIFASCSADGMIRVCSVSGAFITKTLLEHNGEINSVKFSPNGNYLASAGDDRTVKIWNSQSYDITHTLKGHKKEVYTLDWAPDLSNPDLATGSFDSTLKVWNIQYGKCIQTMTHEATLVYCVKYSPDGKLIASGADDGSLLIWSAESGQVLKRFLGYGAIHGMDWYHTGNKLAVCCDSGAVCVIDTRQWMEL